MKKYILELYERKLEGKIESDYIGKEFPKQTTYGDLSSLSSFFIKFIQSKEEIEAKLPKNITILFDD